MDEIKATCSLITEGDDTFLIVNRPEGAKPVEQAEIMALIESSGLDNPDVPAALAALESTDNQVKVKIATKQQKKQRETRGADEKIEIFISRDKMQAEILFTAPEKGGRVHTANDVMRILDNAGVRFGINKMLVQSLTTNRKYGEKLVIAVGKKPTTGTDGKLDFKFSREQKKARPKILEDGKVDFHDVGMFETALMGQTLVVVIPATDGLSGMTVTAENLPAKPGKPAPKLPRGKNTTVSKDDLVLSAEVSGQIIFANNRVDVSPVLEIKEDVGPATGNIDFAGNVSVKGSVKAGFSVKASGYVDVYGAVEACYVEAGGAVNLFGGVKGNDKAVIQCGGNLFTRYAENATLNCDGDIVSDAIMHSNVNCKGALKLEGKKRVLVGGMINVAKSINAHTIGSSMSTPTEIITGQSPDTVLQYDELKEDLAVARVEYDKYDKIVASLLKLGDIKNLPADKKELLVKVMHAKSLYRDKVVELQSKISDMAVQLSTHNGEIVASGRIYAGVKVTVGNAAMYIRDDITQAVLRNEGGKVSVGVYVAK